ncbi:GtrA family protein [Streptomyces sp. NBC_00285]|uniref:GtrA family protein n=1 Tax=Streptomyces sp. NBC_00285 TaxID=2975700 RepID=UPI002E2E3DAD|nr:GtrA family protein [Streptomyces sp. NBC_00285]
METQTADRTQSPSSPALSSPSAPGPFASFARFVVCGGGIGVLSSFAVPLVAMTMPWAVANAVITALSTLLCTELHALFTFGTGRRPGWRQHFQSSGSAVAAYVVTCAAMFLLHTFQSAPSMLTEQAVYLTASGLAGIGRFLVLRLFVFAGTRKPQRPAARTTALPRPVLSQVAVSAAC